MINLFMNLAKLANERVKKFGAQYLTFAVFGTINYPIAYLLGLYLPNSHESMHLVLRLIPFLLCTLMLFFKKWPNHLHKFLPLYWYITLTFSIPVIGVYMLLNQQFSLYWVINFNIGVMILILLVDWLTFLVLEAIGASIGLALYLCSSHSIPNLPNQDIASIFFYMFVCITVLVPVFSCNRELFNIKNLKKREVINMALEAKVADRTVELESALAVKKEFLNNISHEIRTPIMAFSTAANGLIEQWSKFSDKDKFTMADIVAKSANRIKNLSMHLIAATKLQEGEKYLNLQEVNLTNLINDFLDEANALYTKEKKIKLLFNQVANYIIIADPESITQVIRNLVTNAIKYSPVKSTIIIDVDAENDKQLVIKVSDEGVGIPEAEREVIFEPFSQSSRTKTGAGGVGLGLNIAKQIVEAHGGRIWAANSETKGVTFCFTLGYKSEHVDLEGVRGKTILIIDDEDLLLNSMEMTLTGLGCKVLTANSGALSLDLLKKNHQNIDAVVLDVMMPEMDGLEVLQFIKAAYPKTKVIMHSGFASQAQQQQLLKLGAHVFIAKPYQITALIKHL